MYVHTYYNHVCTVEVYIRTYIISYTICKPRETIFIRFGGLKLRRRRRVVVVAVVAEVEVVVVVAVTTVEVDIMTAKEVVPAAVEAAV
jgi:hypothetical protein